MPHSTTTAWTPLTGSTTSTSSDNGTERTLTDTSATEPEKFYTVETTRP